MVLNLKYILSLLQESLINILQTIAVVIIYFILKKIFQRIVFKTKDEKMMHENRGVIMNKLIHFLLLSVGAIFIFLIWGVDQSQLFIFLGSILTVIGVGFFAQWSILSNITSSVIIYFKYPIKINDKVAILEGKDYIIEGKIVHIGLIFITIQTPEEDEITLPNNVFIQKSVKKIKEYTTQTNSVGNQEATNNED